jgi:hypothetical protein
MNRPESGPFRSNMYIEVSRLTKVSDRLPAHGQGI